MKSLSAVKAFRVATALYSASMSVGSRTPRQALADEIAWLRQDFVGLGWLCARAVEIRTAYCHIVPGVNTPINAKLELCSGSRPHGATPGTLPRCCRMNVNPLRALMANYTRLSLAKLLIRQTQDRQRHRFDSLALTSTWRRFSRLLEENLYWDVVLILEGLSRFRSVRRVLSCMTRVHQ
jgi:hypothetical protein